MNHKISSQDAIDELFNLFILRGIPEHIRLDNGPEFTAREVRRWLNRLGVKTFFIERGSPWENRYIESFNAKLRDAPLNRETFTTLHEARVLKSSGGGYIIKCVCIALWGTGLRHLRLY